MTRTQGLSSYTDTDLRTSVVLPVRNRVESLEQTLDTLVTQDLPNTAYEVIVCDDGSTDDIKLLTEKFQSSGISLRIERQSPLGPAAARNMGIRASRADIIIFFDSDVLVESSVVRLLIEALDEHPEWAGAEASLHPTGKQKGILWDAPSCLEGGRYHTAAIAYRRNVLLDVGGFDEYFKLPACEDVEIATRVLQRGPIGFVPNAKVMHPKRRVTLLTHWKWRQHWRYLTILALRYGILAFPDARCGPFPRLRIACSALITLPLGRLRAALRSINSSPADSFLAASFAIFDVICAIVVIPDVLLLAPPDRIDLLASHTKLLLQEYDV